MDNYFITIVNIVIITTEIILIKSDKNCILIFFPNMVFIKSALEFWIANIIIIVND